MSDMSGMDDMSSTSSGSMDMKMYFHGSIGTDMLWFSSWMPTSAGATVGVCIALFILAIFERYLIAFRRACDASWRRGLMGYTRPTSSGPLAGNDVNANGVATSTALASTSTSIESRRSSTRKETYNPLSTSEEKQNEHEQEQELSLPNGPVTPYSAGSSSVPSYPSYPNEKSPAAASVQFKNKNNGNDDGLAEPGPRQGEGYAHLPRAVRRSLDPAREGRWSRPFRWAVDLPRGLLQSLQTLIHYLLMLVVMTFNIWWVISVVVGSGVGEMLFGRFGSSSGGH